MRGMVSNLRTGAESGMVRILGAPFFGKEARQAPCALPLADVVC